MEEITIRRKKITVVGAGNTGSLTALLLAAKALGDIVLFDIPQALNKTSGKALDMLQAAAIFGSGSQIKGTCQLEDTRNSDLVIITAGIARKPGMSRNDLQDINLKIVASLVEDIIKLSPETIFLVLTNPVDLMTYVTYKVSGLPRNRIIGQAGVLDSARYRTFIAHELGISVNDVSALVLGVHGDAMVPLPRFTFVNGVPVEHLLAEKKMQAIIERTRNGGAEIVNLLGDGSACYAPAASLVQMAEAVLMDKHTVMTGVAYLEEEYGYHGLPLGVPLVLGANGIERIIEVDLLAEEKEALDCSAGAVESGLKNINLDNITRKLA